MLKIYCDSGAYRPELKALELAGKVQVFQFKYENKNRNIYRQAQPSSPTWNDMKNYTWDELLKVTWSNIGESTDKRNDIGRIVGTNHDTDVKHLDSAYMAGCKVFLTSDKGDIVSKRQALESLLGLKVFHFLDDWNELVEIVQKEQA